MAVLRRERPESCLSDLALERFLFGELASGQHGPTERHLGECSACRNRCAELAAAPALEPDMVSLRRREKVRRRVPLAAAITSVVALAAAFVLVPRFMTSERAAPAGNDTRLKGGGFTFEVVARRADGRVQPIFEGAVLRPGDAIRFVVTTPGSGQVAVVGMDAAGTVSIYAAPATLAAGTHELPGSVVLDETAGDERLVALLCPTAPARDALVAAGARALAAANGDPRRAPALDVPCRQVGLSFHKDTAHRGAGR